MASLQSLCSVLILFVFLHTAIGASDDPTLDVSKCPSSQSVQSMYQ